MAGGLEPSSSKEGLRLRLAASGAEADLVHFHPGLKTEMI